MDCGLRALPFADGTCETHGTRGTFSSLGLACVRRGDMALPLDRLSAFACCRIWLCLAAICRWQGAKTHSLFQNLLSYLSYASYTSYPLAPHKREAPFMLFDCFLIEVDFRGSDVISYAPLVKL